MGLKTCYEAVLSIKSIVFFLLLLLCYVVVVVVGVQTFSFFSRSACDYVCVCAYFILKLRVSVYCLFDMK